MKRTDQTSDLTALVRLAKAGHVQAVEQLVDRYAPRLFGLLYRMIGSRPDAEDMLQETYVRMLRGLPAYKENGRFEAWLFSIAANLGRDCLRRRARGGPVGLGQADGRELSPCDSTKPGPEHRAAQAEQVDLLQRAIEQLSPAERQIVALRFFSELSFKEISRVLDVPLGTALARAHRALQHLRDRLERPEA